MYLNEVVSVVECKRLLIIDWLNVRVYLLLVSGR